MFHKQVVDAVEETNEFVKNLKIANGHQTVDIFNISGENMAQHLTRKDYRKLL